MIPATVEYVRATSLDEALEALQAPDAKVLAGGQSLVPAMKLRIARPARLVDIGGLELGGIAERNGEIEIGALVTWDEVARAQAFTRPALAAIAECARSIGDLQVRNRGTVAGSLAHADPASDMPAVMLALGAKLTVRSAQDERTLDCAEFFLGPFTTSLGDGELITAVRVPVPAAGFGSSYVAVEHPASGFALAGAAALVGRERRSVALTGVAGVPFLLDGDEEAAIEQAEVFGDRFAPAEYRRQLAATVVRRAITQAEQRAKEDT